MGLVHSISKKIPADCDEGCVSEGCDILCNHRAGLNRVPVKKVKSFLKDKSSHLVAADKEGGFVIIPSEHYKKKAGEALFSVFQPQANVSLPKVKTYAKVSVKG